MTKKSTPVKKSPATSGAKTTAKPAKAAPKKSFDDDDDLDMEDDGMDVDYDKDLDFDDDDDDEDDDY